MTYYAIMPMSRRGAMPMSMPTPLPAHMQPEVYLLPDSGHTLFSDGVVLELTLYSGGKGIPSQTLDDAHMDVVMSPTGFRVHLPFPREQIKRDTCPVMPCAVESKCQTVIGEIGQPVTIRQFHQEITAWLAQDMFGRPRAEHYKDSAFFVPRDDKTSVDPDRVVMKFDKLVSEPYQDWAFPPYGKYDLVLRRGSRLLMFYWMKTAPQEANVRKTSGSSHKSDTPKQAKSWRSTVASQAALPESLD